MKSFNEYEEHVITKEGVNDIAVSSIKEDNYILWAAGNNDKGCFVSKYSLKEKKRAEISIDKSFKIDSINLR